LRPLHKIRNPEIFQGDLKKSHYFEGWYFKLVDDTGKNSIAIIPTIALNRSENNSHAAIQVLDEQKLKYYYLKFPLSRFEASEREFRIRIDKNYFSKSKIQLNIDRAELNLKANLILSNLTPIPTTLWNPGIMGFLSYVPFLQTYHGIVSMDHTIQGEMEINNRTVTFSEKSKGYTEKDWGRSFPSAWIWMQTNHFKREGTSFMCSIANVPLFNQTFIGFLCVFWHKGKFYRFTSYNLSKIRYLKGYKDKAVIFLESNEYFLIIKAFLGETVDMKAPQLGSMDAHSYESMNSRIEVKLFKKDKSIYQIKDSELIFQGTGTKAGLELMNVDKLEVYGN
jgi:tocopherol cyclase